MSDTRSEIEAAALDRRSRTDVLSTAQRKFLEALELDCDSQKPATHVLAGLKPMTLARWLRRDAFGQRLARLLRSVRLKREMTLGLAAGRAAEQLSRSLDDASTLKREAQRACLEIIKLAREHRAQRLARTAESAKSGRREKNLWCAGGAELAHPELPAGEAEALAARLAGSAGGE